MAAIPNGIQVLVTGSTGYLAAHICQQLLTRGYLVRGTVRSEAKGQYLERLYAKSGLKGFTYVLVEDVELPNAFDQAVVGMDLVAHTASPFHFATAGDPYVTLINPAVNGTLSLLRSAQLEPKIKRVVITSSYASILNPIPIVDGKVYTFTEKDWNTYSVEQVEEKGAECDGSSAYRASKTLAERAAWGWLEEHTKDGVAPFDIATINPPLIFGPVIHELASAKSLNTSVALFYEYLTGTTTSDPTAAAGCYVDVRDVAQLHIDALITPEASNLRFAVSNEAFSYQPLLDILHKPEHKDLLQSFPKTLKGTPGAPAPVQNLLDAGRAKKIFGWEPISREKTIVDMTRSLAERQKEW